MEWTSVKQELPPMDLEQYRVVREGYKDSSKNGQDIEYAQGQSFWYTYTKLGFGVTYWKALDWPAPLTT